MKTHLKTLKPKISWGSVKDYVYKNYGQESGKMIVHAGVITWVVSTLSQVMAVVINDKIPKEQKKFLIPQEIADGAINILAFYAVTNSLKNVAGKLVSTGKWSTAAVRNFVEKSELSKTIKMGDMTTNLSKTFKENKEFHDVYDKFKGGMEMIASTVGSVAACNLVTPVIRNYWGAKQQHNSLEKEKINPKPKSELEVHSSVQNRTVLYQKTPVVRAFRVVSGTSMKV